MKDRVLNYLSQLANREGDVDGILVKLSVYTGLSEREIYLRSKKVRNHILHNYTDLSISTIDKFTYSIVRTFASDLGLTNNFDLELDIDKIIDPVVSLLLSRINSSEGDLSRSLIDFALKKANDGKSTDISNDLSKFSTHLFKEESLRYIEKNLDSVSNMVSMRKKLDDRLQTLKNEVLILSKDIESFFNNVGLTDSHFKGKSFYNHMVYNIRDSDYKKWIPSDALDNSVRNSDWYSAAQPEDMKDLVNKNISSLNTYYFDFIGILSEYISIESILNNLYSMTILNELIIELDKYKKDHNVETLSSFNKKVHDVIISQPSSFIYERIGVRYSHFLLDEFQDTSVFQWQNILPLLSDSLDFGKSMIVGDAKQSIYRWRGGEAQQFVDLPEIFNSDILPSSIKNEWEAKIKDHYALDNLSFNFRSSKSIIDFNNDFFGKAKMLLSSRFQNIYDDHYQDSKFSSDRGYVHIELFDKKEFKDLIVNKMISEIRHLVSDKNFSYKDVAVLCNSRNRSSYVAEKLTEAAIPVISNEGLLLSKSDQVFLIISCLRFLQDINNSVAKISIVNYIHHEFLSSEDLHSLNIQSKTYKGFQSILSRSNISFDVNELVDMPLYELVENIIEKFYLKQDIYCQFFLDLILSFSSKYSGHIADFLLFWEERKDKESIVVSEDTDAVQVMTIHKSKGLAFNVVMIPFNWEDTRNTSEIWVDIPDKMGIPLNSALVNSSKRLENSYFNSDFGYEKDLMLLDNINKLYVAMTRAKDRLYIYSKQFPEKLSKKQEHNLLNSGKLNSFLYSYSKNYPLTFGESLSCIDSSINNKKLYSIEDVKNANWRDIVSLKSSSDQVWDIDTYKDEKDWGVLLHFALSKIIYINDKKDVLDNLLVQGKCSELDYRRLDKSLTSILSDKEVMPFFSDGWNVKTEKEILLEDGSSYIPDRFIYNKDSAVVIDYKTGKRREKDKSQIIEYSHILSKLGYKDVERVLIYTSQKNKVVKV